MAPLPCVDKIKLNIISELDRHMIAVELTARYLDNNLVYTIKHEEQRGYDPTQQSTMEKVLSARDIEELENMLLVARIPIVGEGAIGLDGTTFTLNIQARGFSVEYQWWGSLPEGYKALAGVVGWMVGQVGLRVGEGMG